MNKRYMIDILVPNYNNSAYIEECLNSIIAQRIECDFTIYIRDDCSTDDSVVRIKQFIEGNGNVNIVFDQNQSNMGPLYTTIKLYEKVSQPYWTVLDGDDYWLPGFINRALKTLAVNKDLYGYASNTYLLEGGKRTPYYPPSSASGVFSNPGFYPHTSSCVFSSDVLMNGVLKLFYEVQQSGNKYVVQAWEGDSARNALCLSGRKCVYDWGTYGGVYRITGRGRWTSLTAFQKQIATLSLEVTYTAFAIKYELPDSRFSIGEPTARKRLAELRRQARRSADRSGLIEGLNTLNVLDAFVDAAFKKQ